MNQINKKSLQVNLKDIIINHIILGTKASDLNNNKDLPRLITKLQQISSYEDHTVILPCQGINLPPDIHVINLNKLIDHILNE